MPFLLYPAGDIHFMMGVDDAEEESSVGYCRNSIGVVVPDISVYVVISALSSYSKLYLFGP